MLSFSFKRYLSAIAMCFVCVSGFADAVWVDVRSENEHKKDHIEGDLRITHTSIVKELAALYPEKDTEIKLYCRSGRRAAAAMNALQASGYTNVTNVGGIADARAAKAAIAKTNPQTKAVTAPPKVEAPSAASVAPGVLAEQL